MMERQPPLSLPHCVPNCAAFVFIKYVPDSNVQRYNGILVKINHFLVLVVDTYKKEKSYLENRQTFHDKGKKLYFNQQHKRIPA